VLLLMAQLLGDGPLLAGMLLLRPSSSSRRWRPAPVSGTPEEEDWRKEEEGDMDIEDLCSSTV